MEQSRVNKFIIGVGLLTVAFAIYKFSSKKSKPKSKPKKAGVIKDGYQYGLPQRFLDDVAKMDNDELERTIQANANLLQDSKVNGDEKEAIETMLNYLENEQKNRGNE